MSNRGRVYKTVPRPYSLDDAKRRFVVDLDHTTAGKGDWVVIDVFTMDNVEVGHETRDSAIRSARKLEVKHAKLDLL